MRLEVLTIGGEILSGRILDTNLRDLSRALGRFGVWPRWHGSVPDDPSLIREAIEVAMARADGVVISGGLGATPDDRTRESLAGAFGVPLEASAEVWRWIEEKHRERKVTPREAARAMALVPRGFRAVENPHGMAPGLFREGPPFVLALPGVPGEFRVLVERFLLPLIERRLGDARGAEHVLRTSGISETILAERLGDDVPVDCELAYLPHAFGVDLRLTRSLDARTSAEGFQDWVHETAKRVDAWLYGRDHEPIAQAIGDELRRRGLSLATAESCSGGGVGAAISAVPGSSDYFLGSVVAYANAVKETLLAVPTDWIREHGAVSGMVAEAMARGVRRRLGADLGLSVTGIAGPSGGSAEKPVGLVWFGISDARGEVTIARRFVGGRDEITARAVGWSLHYLRRFLLGLPLETTT